MIKKQYNYGNEYGDGVNSQYFRNFLDTLDGERSIWDILSEYGAQKAKCKKKWCYNVKWNDKHLYTLFVLRYS
jgi:hypothetical protein